METHFFKPIKSIGRILVLAIHFAPYFLQAQITLPPSGVNKKASVTEWIGITKVSIDYNRPGVKGREGKIWGDLVHYGFADLHYGTSKAAPWRAGANENTTFEFSTDVNIEGKPLPAGKYGFFVAMGPDKATLIFSNFNTAWGSFYYDAKDDVLRVEVPVLRINDSVERLKYEFSDETDDGAIVSLQWEKIKIPFAIRVDLQKEQIAAFRKEFNSGEFYRYWQNMQAAAEYCLNNNVNLEEGLSWADRSINTYFGEANFITLSTHAGLLEKLNRKKEADSVMQKARPMASLLQLHIFAFNLVRSKRYKEAFDNFKINFDRHPNELYGNVGMAVGYYFIGNTKDALKFAERSKKFADDSESKALVEKLIQDLRDGKGIEI